MSREHPLKIGKYDVISVLGQGGMGTVYQARDPIIDRIVAIKTIRLDTDFSDDNLVKRLEMEAKTAGRLQHPNIVTIFDFGHQDDLTFLAMEFIEGTNLARVISKRLAISLAMKIDIIIQCAEGLAYAHEIGVIHRDIKPANICLTAKGTPKILDFGLARMDETRLTKTGFTSGTVAYMSPERMRGDSGPFDDIFAIGAVAYEILTYQLAFPGKTYRDVVMKIMSKDWPKPPSTHVDLPAGLDLIVLKALATDKADRYATAAELARALELFRSSEVFQEFISGEHLGVTTEQPLDPLLISSSSGAHAYSAGELAELDGPPTVTAPEMDHNVDLPTAQYESGPNVAGFAPPGDEDSPPTLVTSQQDLQDAVEATEKHEAFQYEPTEVDLPPVRVPKDEPPPTELDLPPVERTQATRPARESERVDLRSITGEQPIQKTEVARPGDRPVAPPAAPPPTQQPYVTPIAEPTELNLEALEAAPEEPAVVARMLARPFYPAIAVLLVAVLAAPLVARMLGTFAFLVVYALATVVWTFVVKYAPRMSLARVLFIAVALRGLCFFVEPALSNDIYRYRWDGTISASEMSPWAVVPSDDEVQVLRSDSFTRIDAPDTPANRPPFAELMFLIWTWTGASTIEWRAMLLGVDLLIVWLLWDPRKPRRAIAWATLPFVVLEGVWGGHIELVGAAVLLAAFLVAARQKEFTAGALLGLAAGVSILPAAALPAITHTVNKRLRTWLGFASTVFVPFLFVGIGIALLDPLTRAVKQSPTLSLAQSALSGVFETTNFAARFASGWKDLSGRIGLQRFDNWVALHLDGPALAGIVIALAILAILTIVTHKSRKNENAMANCLGLALLLSFAVHPWYWLFVVPFALLSNRPMWVLFAVFSPALYLASARSGQVNWLVYGVSYIMPLLAVIGAKLSKGEDSRSAFEFD